MEYLLGLIQGLTEFLPISSSGHLVIFGSLFKNVSLPLITFLHIGTLISVIVFFRHKIMGIIIGLLKGRKADLVYLSYILVALTPTVIFGMPLDRIVESLVKKRELIFYLLIINGFILYIIDRIHSGYNKINFKIALFIGTLQLFAVFPGISRSGITIFAGILMGLKKDEAFEFSFLLSIPTIVGAFLFNYIKHRNVDYQILPFIICILSGFIGLLILKYLLKTKRMLYFSIYCWIISFLGIIGII